MKLTSILLAGLILTLAYTAASCDTLDNAHNIAYGTYTNWDCGYMVDYPANWDVMELESHVVLAATGLFSMYAEIHTPIQDIPDSTWLTSKPSWCQDFQILRSDRSLTSFVGSYGQTPVHGNICIKRIEDRSHILTLVWKRDSNSHLPNELQLLFDTFRPIKW